MEKEKSDRKGQDQAGKVGGEWNGLLGGGRSATLLARRYLLPLYSPERRGRQTCQDSIHSSRKLSSGGVRGTFRACGGVNRWDFVVSQDIQGPRILLVVTFMISSVPLISIPCSNVWQ